MTGFSTSRRFLATLLTAGAASAAFSGAAWAETRKFDVPANSAAEGVRAFASQAGIQALISDDVARGKRTNSVRGDLSVAEGWRRLLAGSGLRAEATSEGVFGVVLDASPNTVQSAEPTTVSELIIVGSRNGARSNFDSVAPISGIGHTQLDHAASTPGETGSVISSFVPSFEFPRFSNDGAADALRAGQLRGLKPDETLVLINGKRVHTSAIFAVEGGNGQYTAPYDFNTIPTNAISRVEVLTDGAGAQYGSDAIAGVLNIVLDKSVNNGQLSISYGQRHTDFQPTGQTLDDGGSVTLNGDYGLSLNDKGFVHFGIEYLDRRATNRAGYTQDANGVRGPIPFDANPYASNSSQNTAVALAGRVMTAGDGAQRGVNAFFNGEYTLSPNWAAYAFGTVSYRTNKGAAFFRWPADWGGDGPDGNRNPGPAYPNGYRPITHGVNSDFGMTAGARTALYGWDADFSLTGGQDKFDWGVSNSLNPSFGASSPKAFHLYSAQFAQVTANADFTRRFDLGLYRPLTAAVGAEYRHEDFSTSAGDALSYTSGALIEPVGAEAGPGLTPQDTTSLSRDVGGVYIDLSLPVTDRLTVSTAGRYENYSDFGDTTNGKIASRFEVTPNVALRASISSNYRAPSLAQLGSQTSSQTFSSSANGLVTTLTLAPSSPIAKLLGFSNLKPEKSTNYSVGAAFKFGQVSGSIDAYEIDLEDALAVYPQIGGKAVQSFLLANTGRNIQQVQLLQNLAAYSRTGVDAQIKYSFEIFGGASDIGVNATSGRSRANSSTFSVPAVLTGLGYNPQPYQTTVSRFGATMKTIVYGSWNNDDWSLFARATRWDEEHLAIRRTALFQTLPAAWTIDLDVSKKLTPNISVSAGGQNILDQYPKRQAYANTYYGGLPYSNSQMGFLGTLYYVKIKYVLK